MTGAAKWISGVTEDVTKKAAAEAKGEGGATERISTPWRRVRYGPRDIAMINSTAKWTVSAPGGSPAPAEARACRSAARPIGSQVEGADAAASSATAAPQSDAAPAGATACRSVVGDRQRTGNGRP